MTTRTYLIFHVTVPILAASISGCGKESGPGGPSPDARAIVDRNLERLKSADPGTRSEAAMVVARVGIGDARVRGALETALAKEKNPQVRAAIDMALKRMPEAAP